MAWKEFEEQLGVTRIQIEGDNIPKIASDLNASTFTKEMLNENDYEISIENELNSQKINVTFNKELTFLETFNNFNDLYRDKTFGAGNKYIKYFGINSATPEYIYRNVEILFYNRTKSEESFAVKLKTEYSEFDTSTIQPGEYKFYEDEKYEYYYPTQKTEFVFVSKYPYGMLDMTAEEALKEGIVTIDIFDKYGIEYIKKEK